MFQSDIPQAECCTLVLTLLGVSCDWPQNLPEHLQECVQQAWSAGVTTVLACCTTECVSVFVRDVADVFKKALNSRCITLDK